MTEPMTTGGSGRSGGLLIVDPISSAQVERARQTVAHYAKSARELGELLDALGIGPAWRDSWVGPLAD